jgi:hypothetical protein
MREKELDPTVLLMVGKSERERNAASPRMKGLLKAGKMLANTTC